MSDYVQERMVEAMKADLVRRGMTEDEALDAILEANRPGRASTLGRAVAIVLGVALIALGVGFLVVQMRAGAGFVLIVGAPLAVGAYFLVGGIAAVPLSDLARGAFFARARSRNMLNFPEPPSPNEARFIK